MIERAILIVMDGGGAGTAPDAELFGDKGELCGNTLVNVAKAVGGISIPTLRSLGLGNALTLVGGAPLAHPIGCYGKQRERLYPLCGIGQRGSRKAYTGQDHRTRD